MTDHAQEFDVVIIGGGLAGLTTALALRDSGRRVVVLESDVRLGGRAQSWTDKTTGDPVHIGPHIFLNAYPNMLRLLDLLGTSDRVVWQKAPFITLVDGTKALDIENSGLPAPFHFAPSLARSKVLGIRDVLSNVRITQFALRSREQRLRDLDNTSAAAFIAAMGVSDKMRRWFWSFLSMSLLNVPLEICSTGALLRVYRGMMGNANVWCGFADGGLGELFAEQARAMIERHGGQVWLSTRARRVIEEGGAVTGVELDDGRVLGARKVVAALPPLETLRLIPRRVVDSHPELRKLARYVPVPYVATQMWFDEKLTERSFWARAYSPNDLNCDFYDLSNINSGWKQRPSVIATNCIWSHRADHLSDEEHVAQTIHELAEFIPRAKTAKLVHYVINRIPMAIHAPIPGMESCRLHQKAPIEGLLFAGDWTDTKMPSSMESAAYSGWKAGEMLLADFGSPKALANERWTIHPSARATAIIPEFVLRPPPVPRIEV